MRSYIKYLIPSMLSMIAVSCYAFVDTYVVGRAIGSVAVGAMGLCTPVLSTLYALEEVMGPDAVWYAIPLGEGLAMLMAIVFRIREKHTGAR